MLSCLTKLKHTTEDEYHIWLDKQHEFFSNHRLLFRSSFENKDFYAEACSNISENCVKIYTWNKTLITQKVNYKCDDECSICLQKLKNKHSIIIPCNHRFHTTCIESHITSVQSSNRVPLCPLCRGGNQNSLKEIELSKLKFNTDDDDDDYDDYDSRYSIFEIM